MTDDQLGKISTFYLNQFISPILKSANTDMLKQYIKIANDLINKMSGLVLGVQSFSDTIENIELTQLFDLDNAPVVSLVSITVDGDELDIENDYKYKIHPHSILFYNQIAIGTVVISYTAGIALDESLMLAHCMEVNHLINSKMIETERIGQMAITPDRSSVPKEVMALVNESSIGVQI